jgi:hypothetical protein
MTHAPIECAQQIRQKQVRPDDIAALTLSVNLGSSRICNIQAPADGLQAKFSLRQTVAMALSGVDTAGLDSYSVATATDTALVRLRERLELDFREDLPEAGAELSVTLRDGKTLHATHDAGLAMTDFAAQGARLADKFDALVEPVLGAARARELRGMIEELDDVTEIGALARLAAG